MDNQDKNSPAIFQDLIEDLLNSYLEIGRNLSLKGLSVWLSVINATLLSNKNRLTESVSLLAKFWSTLFTYTYDPKLRSWLMEETEKVPEYFLELTKTSFENLGHIQDLSLERMSRLFEKTALSKIFAEEVELINLIRQIYDAEVKWLYHIPQVGLARYYQERFNLLGDQWNKLNISIGQFLITLFSPIEDSFRATLNEMTSSIEQGIMPESARTIYNKWLKYLEDQYLSLFKSPQFINVLQEMLTEIENFSLIKNRVLQDMLQFLPIPTNREMDELYKEVYLLKKKINQLEQNLSARTVPSSSAGQEEEE